MLRTCEVVIEILLPKPFNILAQAICFFFANKPNQSVITYFDEKKKVLLHNYYV